MPASAGEYILLRTSGQVYRRASATEADDISQRGDSAAFDLQFKVLIENISAMMHSSDDSLHKFSAPFNAIVDGEVTRVWTVGSRACPRTCATMPTAPWRSSQSSSASGSVNTAGVETASGSKDLSQRTEQQARNLEEPAAFTEDLPSAVR